MDLKIEGKVALITGSTQGIGFATAKKLCEEKASVILNGRNEKRVNEAILKLQTLYPEAKVSGVVANLENKEGCDSLISKIPHVDILINNLGIFEPVDFEKISEEQWLEMFNTNVMSGVRLSQNYLTKMLSNNWGRIIFISSESAYQIPKEMIHYGVSKTAQISLARGIAECTKGTNVTSNSIIVGPSNSEGVAGFIQDLADSSGQSFEEIEKDFFLNVRPTSLLQRLSDVEEIANMIVYTASSLSTATNGAALRVDAGVVQSAV